MIGLIFIIYFALIIFSTILCFLVGGYVFLRDPFSLKNRVFFFLCLASGIFSGGEAMGIWTGIIPGLPENYLFWSKINVSGGWLALPLFMILALAISERRDLLKNKIFSIFIWSFPLIFIVALIFTPYYLYINSEGKVVVSPLFRIAGSAYAILCFSIFLYFLFKGYRETKPFFRKKQLKYLIGGLSLPVIVTIFYFSILIFVPQDLANKLFSINPVAVSLGFGMVVVGIGILKYGIFIDRNEVLNILFERLSELVLVVDKPGRIILVNKSGALRLSYSQGELVDKSVDDLLRKSKIKWQELIQVLEKNKRLTNKRLIFLTKDQREAPFLANLFLLKRGQVVLVGKDIGEMLQYQERLEKEVKERTKELERKINELERFHRLAVGRELKMIELKKEIKRL